MKGTSHGASQTVDWISKHVICTPPLAHYTPSDVNSDRNQCHDPTEPVKKLQKRIVLAFIVFGHLPSPDKPIGSSESAVVIHFQCTSALTVFFWRRLIGSWRRLRSGLHKTENGKRSLLRSHFYTTRSGGERVSTNSVKCRRKVSVNGGCIGFFVRGVFALCTRRSCTP